MKNLTYRKALNRGWEPVLYRTDVGHRVACIVKRGTKWMHIVFATGERKRVLLTEERYMRSMTSKRGA